MNRATSLLWATTVALVLSAGPVYAGKKVVQFPNKIQHTRVISHDALNTVVESNNVPEQSLSNRDGSSVVKFKPKAVKKAPKAPIKERMKNVLKSKPTQVVLQVAIMGALTAVDWVMSDDNTKLQKKESTLDSTQVGGNASGFDPQYICGNMTAAQTLSKITVVTYNGATYAVAVFPATASAAWSGPSGYTASPNNCTQTAKGYAPNAQGYWPMSRARTISLADITTTKKDLSESDFDTFVNSFDSKSAADYEGIYNAFAAIDPEIGMFLPDYLTAPDGTFVQAMSSPLRQTQIARLNPDGSTSRLTRKEWSDFVLNYNNASPTIDYKVTNKTEVTNEAGQKVEEESVTEEDQGEESMPELSPVLEQANKPLENWATEIKTPPSSTTGGISYPVLFTYGGTCSVAPIVLPVIGSYSLDSICVAVNEWVKPILAVMFAAWSVLHIFGLWRETTLNVRPT
ncbi:hypothetical protein [Pseudomonas sp. TCU-HL1]|uniref:hypothetical protein n=1 Tax=Pseudomonas sp. TCU-HL1 TaxID=1856685 RepID=UPI000858C8D0|nr:hypothetical protein [Pseudomonas sp. TCU-HL1]AOE85533.1 hypothetical protein THL1_2985 [Pseudomonas sp. TCU-HL1]AOE85545.1 hypothetical protein THL1_2997 [Pseudomonas sp. TCU-HL1]